MKVLIPVKVARGIGGSSMFGDFLADLAVKRALMPGYQNLLLDD